MRIPRDEKDHFESSALESLKNRGFRVTKPRRLIVKALAQFEGLFAASQVFEVVNDKLKGKVDLATVYRVLTVLQELDLVHQSPGSQEFLICRHAEYRHPVHVIYRCSTCHESVESHLPKKLSQAMSDSIETTDFSPSSAVLQIIGKCSKCQPE